MLTKYISIPLFLSSFIIGLVFIFFWGPESKIIHKYPSPANYKTILYKDKVNQCYQFKPLLTDCPINPFNVKTIPVQE
jgi:hypothetical protein